MNKKTFPISRLTVLAVLLLALSLAFPALARAVAFDYLPDTDRSSELSFFDLQEPDLSQEDIFEPDVPEAGESTDPNFPEAENNLDTKTPETEIKGFAGLSAPEEDEVTGTDEDSDPADALLELDSTTVIVYSYKGLAKALKENNGYSLIYLGDNIVGELLGEGIFIHPSKAEVIIDGCPPENPSNLRYTYTQYDAKTQAAAISVAAGNATTRSVVMRNIILNGASNSGIVFVESGVNGACVVFENITYSGPQALYNFHGTARLINSTFLTASSVSSKAQELIEANIVEIYGTVRLESTSSTGATLLVLSSLEPRLTVMANAHCYSNTQDHFFSVTKDSEPVIEIHAGATFSLNTKKGFALYDRMVKEFLIGPNASVSIAHNATGSNACLYISQLLKAQPGSSLSIIRTGTSGGIIRFNTAGGRAEFDDPKRVFLSGTGLAIIRFSEQGALSIETVSINLWKTKNAPRPTYVWNDKNSSLFRLDGSYSGATAQTILSTLSNAAPISTELSKATFNLENAAILSFGRLELSIDPVFTNSTALTGDTSGGAELLAYYTTESSQRIETTGTADVNGAFNLPLSTGTLKLGTIITAEATVDSLTVRDTTEVLNAGDYSLSLVSVPKTISFSGNQIPAVTTVFSRNEESFAVSVLDSRLKMSPWRLDVELCAPPAAEVNGTTHYLEDALIIIANNGVEFTLTSTALTVYRENSGLSGEHIISWASNEGILLKVQPGSVYSNVSYSGLVQWSLIDAP